LATDSSSLNILNLSRDLHCSSKHIWFCPQIAGANTTKGW
jgi:hypothetical protein